MIKTMKMLFFLVFCMITAFPSFCSRAANYEQLVVYGAEQLQEWQLEDFKKDITPIPDEIADFYTAMGGEIHFDNQPFCNDKEKATGLFYYEGLRKNHIDLRYDNYAAQYMLYENFVLHEFGHFILI